MKHLRQFLISFLIICPLSMLAQSHDFEIKNFQENLTDLSAISSSVKDINGKPTALIRFAVRDAQFEFDANLGIVKQEKKTGEVWLFVPSGTKRLTISHPHLGVIRGYKIPLSVKGKNTYDAEIEITNKEYLQTLYATTETAVADVAEVPEVAEESLNTDSTLVETPDSIFSQPLDVLFNDSLDIINDSVRLDSISDSAKVHKPLIVDIYAGVGFNAICLMGPSIAVGANINNIHVEASFTFGIDKVENIGVNYTARDNNGFLGEVNDYSCNRFAFRAGYMLAASKSFFITPHAGVAFNMINGSNKMKGNNNNQFGSITQMSAFIGLSLDIKLSKTVYLYATPQYHFLAGANNAYKVIKEADSKIKSWCEGLGINVGIKLHF